MRSQRTKDTGPERAVRSLLHRRGLRYVLHATVPGTRRKVDIAFMRARVAVLLDGCYWHACPKHATWPKANAAWWRAKIDANRARDASTTELLSAAGWKVIRVWEHEVKEDAAGCARRIASEVKGRRSQASGNTKPDP